jgi:hypothetical protein
MMSKEKHCTELPQNSCFLLGLPNSGDDGLPGKCKDPSSNPRPTKKKKEKRTLFLAQITLLSKTVTLTTQPIIQSQ